VSHEKEISMVYVWEFEFFESGGYVNAWPCPPMEGGTFGVDFDDAMDSAVDWLSGMVDAHLTDGLELPERSLGHEPRHGGTVIAVAVSRELGDIPAMTAADAARELGVSSARVAQLCKAGLLDSWRDGTRRMVSRASVEARKEDVPAAGRPLAVTI